MVRKGSWDRILLFVLLLAGPVFARGWRFGVALEGQMLPLGLVGFAEYQNGATGFQGRMGWDLLGGGFFLGSEGFWQPTTASRYALGLVWYPGVGRVAEDVGFTGLMFFPCVGNRRENSGWVFAGAGLPLQPSFYKGIRGNWGFLALFRARMEVVRAQNP